MSVKLFIDTKNVPVFTDRVDVAFDLNKRSKHTPHLILNDESKKWEAPNYGFLTAGQDRRYWYEDEWGDMNLGEILGYGGKDRFKIWHEFEMKMSFEERKEFLTKLSELEDERIFSHFNGQWYRPVPYWKMYRILTKDYLLAKRDFLKSLVEAEITDIHIMAVYIPPDRIHKKQKTEWH